MRTHESTSIELESEQYTNHHTERSSRAVDRTLRSSRANHAAASGSNCAQVTSTSFCNQSAGTRCRSLALGKATTVQPAAVALATAAVTQAAITSAELAMLSIATVRPLLIQMLRLLSLSSQACSCSCASSAQACLWQQACFSAGSLHRHSQAGRFRVSGLYRDS